jgi:hypothetical protein
MSRNITFLLMYHRHELSDLDGRAAWDLSALNELVKKSDFLLTRPRRTEPQWGWNRDEVHSGGKLQISRILGSEQHKRCSSASRLYSVPLMQNKPRPASGPVIRSGLAQAVQLLTCILEVSGSHLVRDTEYPDVSGGFSWSLQAKCHLTSFQIRTNS